MAPPGSLISILRKVRISVFISSLMFCYSYFRFSCFHSCYVVNITAFYYFSNISIINFIYIFVTFTAPNLISWIHTWGGFFSNIIFSSAYLSHVFISGISFIISSFKFHFHYVIYFYCAITSLIFYFITS